MDAEMMMQREMNMCAQLALSFLFRVRTSAYVMVLPTIRVDFLTSVNPVWNSIMTCPELCLQVTEGSDKLTVLTIRATEDSIPAAQALTHEHIEEKVYAWERD